MSVTIGSARINEKGTTKGGKLGDNNEKEVSTQDFYVHSKGWYIIRAKDKKHRKALADAMIRACKNDMVGYDQDRRHRILTDATTSHTPTACDCSSLVRQCIKEATEKDPGNFTTYNEVAILKATKLFEEPKVYTSKTKLEVGDILVTKVKGHTAIVVKSTTTKTKDSLEQVAKDVINGKYGNGQARKDALAKAGYDHKKVQNLVNKMLKEG